MEVNITARNLTVSDRFREYVADRTHKVEQLAHKVQALDIKVTRHDHSRNSGPEDQVELTVFEPGHVIRAEAHAGDKFAAFDIAFGKLSERLRRAADRRKHHHGGPGASELSVATSPVLMFDLPTQMSCWVRLLPKLMLMHQIWERAQL